MEQNIGSPTRPVGNHKKAAAGEVDYKTKSGTAWSHNYLNQKPWHPLSYPNQRRKWIAEQTDAQSKLRAEEIAREFAQEQEFFRQTALVSKKEKEKMEMMKAVSFMYVRPPGYNAESAKAAEIADEEKKLEQIDHTSQQQTNAPPTMPEVGQGKDHSLGERKKDRPKDVFGRALPSEEDFEVLKNAPRMNTGVPVRIKPFAVEIRNVRCVRCGNYGHQSGDRECLLKDAIMPNDESRLQRDDPLRAMMAHTDVSEPVKWELKQRPGMSPPRGGFQPDDPNQQIVPDDIFDEYGGFLGGGGIPAELLTSIGARKIKKHSSRNGNHKQRLLAADRKIRSSADRSSSSSSTDTDVEPRKSKTKRVKRKRRQYKNSDPSETSSERHDSDAEVLRRLKSKHARRIGQPNQDSYPWEAYSARRRQIKHSASPSSSSDSRSQMRKLKRKHLNKTKRDHSLRSDHDRGKGESCRKTERKGRHYHDDSSHASGDDNWE